MSVFRRSRRAHRPVTVVTNADEQQLMAIYGPCRRCGGLRDAVTHIDPAGNRHTKMVCLTSGCGQG